jgi:hypothetical protein
MLCWVTASVLCCAFLLELSQGEYHVDRGSFRSETVLWLCIYPVRQLLNYVRSHVGEYFTDNAQQGYRHVVSTVTAISLLVSWGTYSFHPELTQQNVQVFKEWSLCIFYFRWDSIQPWRFLFLWLCVSSSSSMTGNHSTTSSVATEIVFSVPYRSE